MSLDSIDKKHNISGILFRYGYVQYNMMNVKERNELYENIAKNEGYKSRRGYLYKISVVCTGYVYLYRFISFIGEEKKRKGNE